MKYSHLPTITRPYLQRVIPTQIWCRSVINPRLALIQPKSAFILRPSPVVISSIFLERTVDRSTIPNSLPAQENDNFLKALFTEMYWLVKRTLAVGNSLHTNISHSIIPELFPNLLPLSRVRSESSYLCSIHSIINQLPCNFGLW